MPHIPEATRLKLLTGTVDSTAPQRGTTEMLVLGVGTQLSHSQSCHDLYRHVIHLISQHWPIEMKLFQVNRGTWRPWVRLGITLGGVIWKLAIDFFSVPGQSRKNFCGERHVCHRFVEPSGKLSPAAVSPYAPRCTQPRDADTDLISFATKN